MVENQNPPDPIMNEYNGQYLYPPRPEQAIMPNMLGFYEKRGYVAQYKMNGTNNIAMVKGGHFHCMNRHEEDHRAWKATPATTNLLQKVSGGKWIVVIAELMHNKVPGIREQNYINEILVHEGHTLYGTTYGERLELLQKLFLPFQTGETESHYILDDHWWLAKVLTTGFRETFQSLSKPEHEGLVIKDPKAKLLPCVKIKSNVKWMVKCRKVSKNYGF